MYATMSCDCQVTESLFHNQLLLKLVESNDDSFSVIYRLVEEGNDDDNHSCSMIHRLMESDDNNDQTDGR